MEYSLLTWFYATGDVATPIMAPKCEKKSEIIKAEKIKSSIKFGCGKQLMIGCLFPAWVPDSCLIKM
jgi:hypothetical protein